MLIASGIAGMLAAAAVTAARARQPARTTIANRRDTARPFASVARSVGVAPAGGAGVPVSRPSPLRRSAGGERPGRSRPPDRPRAAGRR